MTGYITAQPTATAKYTYLHDTAITGLLTSVRVAVPLPSLYIPRCLNYVRSIHGAVVCQFWSVLTNAALSRVVGYSKWDGGAIGWSFHELGTTNGLSDGTPMYTLTAEVSDDLAALQGLATLSYTPALDAVIAADGLGSGRYLRVRQVIRLTSPSEPYLVGAPCPLGPRVLPSATLCNWSPVLHHTRQDVQLILRFLGFRR